jgi:16S rRNA (guanine1207-N2)-methyltransferase
VSDGHYFDEAPTAESRPSTVVLKLADSSVTLTSDRGVFAAGHPDPGTVVLLEAAPAPPAAGDLLDLGCGYGPIAVTLARRSPGATVWALDVNARALALTEDNAGRLGLGNVRAVTAGQLPDTVRFAEIWSNPPIRIGKQALHDLLTSWLARLAGGAAAYLVVQRNLGSDSLQRWLADSGWQASRLAARAGYRVLEVRQ